MAELFQLEYSGPRLFPDRLKEAREAMGLSMTELASLISVTPQAVSQYESGDKNPEWNTLSRIAAKLDQPISYFTTERPVGGKSDAATFFRSFKSRTKATNRMMRRWSKWASEITTYVEGVVNLPELVIPSPGDITCYSEDDIEYWANQCRRMWGLGDGPITNVVALLESKGFVVVRTNFGVDNVDAFSCWQDGRPFIFLGSDKDCAVRSRFDAAHELAHMVLHRHLNQDQIEDNTILDLIEAEANRFASAFLLPEKTFVSEIFSSNLDQFRDLKSRWKVSIAAMIHRCRDLGVFDEQQYVNLRKQLSSRKWLKSEPLDDILPIEQSTLISTAINLTVDAGIRRVSDLLVDFRLSTKKLSAIVGCDEHFWASEESTTVAPIVGLKPIS